MSQSSPIYTLHPDVLHEIFLTNTYRDLTTWLSSKSQLDLNFSPLTIARHSSQVCATWRSILLQAPSIWARCIDLDALDQERDEWRELVLKRTGSQAPLSVTSLVVAHSRIQHNISEVGTGNSLANSFLVNLLHHQWNRIRELNIAVDNWRDLRDERLLKVFQHPAPHLEVFVLRSPHTSLLPLPSMTKETSMFSNHAPSLVRYSSPSLLWYPTDITSPLFGHNMRHLDLQRSLHTTPSDLIHACLRMPRLETLRIYIESLRDVDKHKLPRPVMAHLNMINILSKVLDVYPFFLDRITPVDGCCFCMNHLMIDTIPSSRMVQSMLSAFRRSTQSFLDHHGDKPDFADVTVSASAAPLSFTFSCYRRKFSLWFVYLHNPRDAMAHLLTGLLDAVSELKFPDTVYHLDLKMDISYRLPENPILRRDLVALLPHILGTLEALPWVTTLTIKHHQWMSLLIYLPEFNNALFPFLKTLILDEVYHGLNVTEHIMPYILARRRPNCAAPMEVLELLFFLAPVEADLRPLDKIAGLKVVWTASLSANGGTTQHSYICGTGMSDKLWLRG